MLRVAVAAVRYPPRASIYLELEYWDLTVGAELRADDVGS